MKFKRKKLIEMWGLINKILSERTSVKFHYLMLKNKKLLEPEIESLQKSSEAPEDRTEFDEKRIALCREHAELEEDGNPKINGEAFVIDPEKKDEFEAKIDELKEEYKELLESLDKRQQDFLSLLAEEVTVDLVKIPMSVMPDQLDGTDVELLFDLIDENL